MGKKRDILDIRRDNTTLFYELGLKPRTHYAARVILYPANVEHTVLLVTSWEPEHSCMLFNRSYEGEVLRQVNLSRLSRVTIIKELPELE